MNTADWASSLRIALIPFILLMIFSPWDGTYLIAAGLYLVAALTDVLDGYLARRKKDSSPKGAILDLTADKLLVSSTIIALVGQKLLPAWVAIVIVARELVVTGLRNYAASRGQRIPPNIWGKTKTAVTSLAIIGIMLREDWEQGGLTAQANFSGLSGAVLSLAWPLMIVTIALTLLSGANYFFAQVRGLHGHD